MGLFVTSDPGPTRGVYARSVPPPATIAAAGTGNSIIVGQAPWGPSNQLVYPGSMAQFWQTYAPAGMTRTGSFHLNTIRKGWPQLGAVRVADPAAVAATCIVQTAGSTTVLNVTALYSGTQGNSLIVTIGAPSNGLANYFNFSVSVTSASGTTTETYANCNVSAAGGTLPNLANSALLASVTQAANGVPANGSITMTGGTNGTVTSAMYVGTPGANDKGFALLESDDTINFVFTDDPGVSFRPAVNAGLVAHANLTSDRIGIISGIAGQTAAAAQTDVASYASPWVVYTDPWVYIYDDTTGALQLQPGACWAASVAAQIPPSLSISARMQAVTGLLGGIAKLEANRGAFRSANTQAGISTLIPGISSPYTFEAGVVTSTIPGQTNLTRSRMVIYIAESAQMSWDPFVDAPNVGFFQQDLVNSLDTFLSTLKGNVKLNPAALPYIQNYAILPLSASNTNATLAAGDFSIGAQIQIGSNMSRIFLNMQAGETVVVQAA